MAEYREFAAIRQLETLNLRSKLSGNNLKVYDAMIVDLQKTQEEFNAMNNTLSEKNSELNETKKLLSTRTLELDDTKKQLSSRTLELDDTKKQLSSRTLELDDTKKQLSSRTLELDNTKNQLTSRTRELDDAQKQLNSQLLKLDETEKILDEKLIELAQKSFDLKTAKSEYDLQSKALAENSEALTRAKIDLEKVKKMASYSTDDISALLNNTIKEFNESKAYEDKMARYVINSMDVDLKVRVFDDSENDKKNPIKFVAPRVNETSEDSLSSIKISIQAVPK
ncbi:MAG: hypothetical protein J6T62_04855 [Fibrobacter sp.]|nr:hypothetical protein [Fibrobacter sp.]